MTPKEEYWAESMQIQAMRPNLHRAGQMPWSPEKCGLSREIWTCTTRRQPKRPRCRGLHPRQLATKRSLPPKSMRPSAPSAQSPPDRNRLAEDLISASLPRSFWWFVRIWRNALSEYPEWHFFVKRTMPCFSFPKPKVSILFL